MKLTGVKTGRWITVQALPDNPIALQEARSLGIAPGRPLRVIRRAPFWGPLLVDVEGKTVAVAWWLAFRLEVQPISAGDRPPQPID